MSVTGFVTSGATLTRPPCALRAARPATTPARRPVPYMVAATSTGAALSDRAAELLSWVRAHKSIFSPGTGFTATHLALFRKNDTARCMVPAIELDCNAEMLPGVAVARAMLERADEIFEAAKAVVLKEMPALESEEAVAKIMYHDLRYFLRVTSYGIACGSPNFIHVNNLGIVKQLYAEIGLTDSTVQAGIASLKASVLADASSAEEMENVARCFDSLSEALRVSA
jgi:Phycobilisome protein